uniref:Long-chain fatty acid--CoA ligase n=1 Tax=candidate division WOR-3 bacterium TaxID=2052148 RepID=A0A7C4UGF4_UNCW3
MKFKRIRNPLPIVTIPEAFQRAVFENPDRIALMMKIGDKWEKVTYKELMKKVRRFASYLKKIGVKKGEHIALRGANSFEWIISALSILWLGGVIVPLDARLTLSEVLHFMKLSDTKFIITDDSAIDSQDEVRYLFFKDINRLMGETEIEMTKYEPEELAVLFSTSGTTSDSKIAMLTHKNIISNISQMYQALFFKPGDTQFLILPLHHVFPFTVAFVLSLTLGLTISIGRSLKPNEMKEDLIHTKPQIFIVVPLLLEKVVKGIEKEIKKQKIIKKGMLKIFEGISIPFLRTNFKVASKTLFRPIRKGLGLERLRYLISGGSALPVWVSRKLELWGFPILQGYGLTETSPVLSVNPPSRPKNASVGLPLPDVEIKIIEPIDGIGEIVAKGDNIFKGYYKNENATRNAFIDGWFRTGDLGYIDRYGYIYIAGRAKSVIVTKGGKNIYPEEIEEKLQDIEYISEVLVTMEIDERSNTEELTANIYPNWEAIDNYCKENNIPVDNDKIYEIISKEIQKKNEHLADYKKIRRIVIRDEEFPKTAAMKIKRYLFIDKGKILK